MKLYRRLKLWLIERKVRKQMYRHFSGEFDKLIELYQPKDQERIKKLKTQFLEEYTKD